MTAMVPPADSLVAPPPLVLGLLPAEVSEEPPQAASPTVNVTATAAVVSLRNMVCPSRSGWVLC